MSTAGEHTGGAGGGGGGGVGLAVVSYTAVALKSSQVLRDCVRGN